MPDAPDPAPTRRGPASPEGKARSSMNALRHGLRARTFGILPGEDQAEWNRHLDELRQGYGPRDDTEVKLVEAIAAAMWHEIRADRTLAEVMVAIPPLDEGRPHGGDLQELRHALSLNTALRYLTAASMATQRAQRAFLAHRKAGRDGLLGPQPAAPEAANANCTNENRPRRLPAPDPLAALRARLDRLLDGPGPRTSEEWDLVAAIRAQKPPGAPPYRGPIEPVLLAQALDGLGFDAAGLAWLAGFGAAPAPARAAATDSTTFALANRWEGWPHVAAQPEAAAPAAPAPSDADLATADR